MADAVALLDGLSDDDEDGKGDDPDGDDDEFDEDDVPTVILNDVSLEQAQAAAAAADAGVRAAEAVV